MPTTTQEIDCPECDEGQIEFMSGHTITDVRQCETCHGRGKVTVIPCPRHGTDGYTYSMGGPTLDCMDCRADGGAAGSGSDEICNVNHLLTAECIVPPELIAIAEASARGEDYDWDRFNLLFQGAR